MDRIFLFAIVALDQFFKYPKDQPIPCVSAEWFVYILVVVVMMLMGVANILSDHTSKGKIKLIHLPIFRIKLLYFI
jgi:hypothetical protein